MLQKLFFLFAILFFSGFFTVDNSNRNIHLQKKWIKDLNLISDRTIKSDLQNIKPDGINSYIEEDSLAKLLNSQGQSNIPLLLDNLKIVAGLEYSYLHEPGKNDMTRVTQLKEGLKIGWAEDYFFEVTGKYDLTIFYVDGKKGNSSVEIFINNQKAGGILMGATDSFKEQTIKGINIQQWSKIELEFRGDGNERCRVVNLLFTYTGNFNGKTEKLNKPLSLDVFETADKKNYGRTMLTNFVGVRLDSLMKKREAEIGLLSTPEDWAVRQNEIRRQLGEIFGEFPRKTALKPLITGKLDRDGYVIEKIIFESQPGYYVSGNLYLPSNREFPVPGVIFTCGHSDNGKAMEYYHETCLGLVNKGYVVLAFDPMGQGERSEYFDRENKKNIISLSTGQHMYLGRTSFLVDWSLAGLRIWDGIRAVDYLVSRPEVDQNKLSIVGNSGGGQMALLIAAADERIGVCIAAHPGGPMENRYLKGFGILSQSLIDREIMSLIAPRPCRIIVGRDSGEEPRHRAIFEDMQTVYQGFGKKELVDFVLVDGFHDMKQPKRVASYEWLNKWFDKQEEGIDEADLHIEEEKNLLCTDSGFTLLSYGGETGQTLNVKRLEKIYKPAKNDTKLKEKVAERIGLQWDRPAMEPVVYSHTEINYKNINIEKFAYKSEKGVVVPALLYKPFNLKSSGPLYLHISDQGKPDRFDPSGLPLNLASKGDLVMSIDVRGLGETSPSPPLVLNNSVFSIELPPNVPLQYRLRYKSEVLAVQSTSFGQTLTGMRVCDILKGLELIHSREDLKDRDIILVGEGAAGFWALLAAFYDSNVQGLVTIGTMPSLKLLITSKYYNVWDYFWMPGILRDFDIPDIAKRLTKIPQFWIAPIDARAEKLSTGSARNIIGRGPNIHLITDDDEGEWKSRLESIIGETN